MNRTVTYSVVERKNPNTPEDPGKFYAQVQARGEMGIREIAERIQRECTLTRADTIAVLTALEDVVSEGLQRGEIVRLGELGSLQVSVSGQGVEKEEEYNDGLIERKRILFRPGRTLRDTLSTLSFERVEVKPKSKGKTEEEVLLQGQVLTDGCRPTVVS